MVDKRLLAQGEQRREDILTFIRSYVAERGFSPTNREIAAAVGIQQNAVRHHLRLLANAGRIRLEPNKARAIVLLERTA